MPSMLLITAVGVAVSGGTVGNISDFQLGPGQFPASRRAMEIIHPRADVGSDTYASHRLGRQNRKYQERLIYRGGTGLVMARLTAGPSGATCGGQPVGSWSGLVSDGTRRLPVSYVGNSGVQQRYLCIEYTRGAGTGVETFTAEVRDQAGTTETVTWTVNFDDANWAILSTSGDDVTGDGTPGAPLRSMAPVAAGGYGNKGVWFEDSGTFEVAATSGNSNYTVTSSASHPIALCGNPNATPVLTMPGIWVSAATNQVSLKNLELLHTAGSGTDQVMLGVQNQVADCKIYDCHISGFTLNSTGNNNGGILRVNGTSGTARAERTSYAFNRHSGQQGAAWQAFDVTGAILCCDWTSPCTFNQADGSHVGVVHLKDSNADVTIDMLDFRGSHTYSGIAADVSWRGQGRGTEDVQLRFSYLTRTASGRNAALRQGTGTTGEGFLRVYVERNTIHTANLEKDAAFITDFERNNNVLYGDDFETNASTSDTGNLELSDSVTVDADLYLTGAFASSRGTVGAEVAA